jgi:hypothetical protein
MNLKTLLYGELSPNTRKLSPNTRKLSLMNV